MWRPALPLTGSTPARVWAQSRGPMEPPVRAGVDTSLSGHPNRGHLLAVHEAQERPEVSRRSPQARSDADPASLPHARPCRARTQGRPSLEVRLDPGLCQPSRSGCRQPGGLLSSRHPQSEPREGRGFPRSLWRANPGRSLHHVISENRNFRSIIWGQPAHTPPWAGSLGRMQSAEAPGPPSAVGVAVAGR